MPNTPQALTIEREDYSDRTLLFTNARIQVVAHSADPATGLLRQTWEVTSADRIAALLPPT